jgi:hypothetical protein
MKYIKKNVMEGISLHENCGGAEVNNVFLSVVLCIICLLVTPPTNVCDVDSNM